MMKRHLFLWFLCAILFLPEAILALDELLSARCQSECLTKLEDVAKKDGIRRRQLKHRIIDLCKEDLNCSSCILPCSDPFETAQDCKLNSCHEGKSPADCEKSCDFLEQVYSNKPGTCAAPKLTSTEECVASCRRDADCVDSAKCCSNGCGRSCALPASISDPRLIPVPDGIGVHERKRGRSAIVRWTLPGLKKRHHSGTWANLYVVQWKWGVHEQLSTMTRWQTIAIRTKLYAILKHLLSPGRYYIFRVAAVNRRGTSGYSSPSQPFKLSKEPRAPGQPRNLEVGSSTLKEDNTVTQQINWMPPDSDLPIVHYQISWTESNDKMKPNDNGFGPRRAALMSDMPAKDERRFGKSDNEGGDFFEGKDTTKMIISSEQTEAELRGLQRDTLYMVEVSAIVDSETGEIHGEKGVLFVKTDTASTNFNSPTSVFNAREIVLHTVAPVSQSTTTTTTISATTTTTTRAATRTKNTNDEFSGMSEMSEHSSANRKQLIKNLTVSEAVFDAADGRLQAVVTWRISAENLVSYDFRDVKFELSWRPTYCIGEDRLLTEIDVITSGVFEAESRSTAHRLHNLQFDCTYNLTLLAVLNSRVMSSESSQIFSTLSCHHLLGADNILCRKMANDRLTMRNTAPHALQCKTVGSQNEPKNISALCSWTSPEIAQAIAGYKVTIVTRSEKGSYNKKPSLTTRMLTGSETEIFLDQLDLSTSYLIQVQTLLSEGLVGRTAVALNTNYEPDWTLPDSFHPDVPYITSRDDDDGEHFTENRLPLEKIESSHSLSVVLCRYAHFTSTLFALAAIIICYFSAR